MPFYWRIIDTEHTMSLAHGTAMTQDGMARQVEAFLATVPTPKILAPDDVPVGVELVVQRVRE